MNLIKGTFSTKVPKDTPRLMREIADQIDAGKVTGLVMAYVKDDRYELRFSTTIEESLVLATLLHVAAVDSFKESE